MTQAFHITLMGLKSRWSGCLCSPFGQLRPLPISVTLGEMTALISGGFLVLLLLASPAQQEPAHTPSSDAACRAAEQGEPVGGQQPGRERSARASGPIVSLNLHFSVIKPGSAFQLGLEASLLSGQGRRMMALLNLGRQDGPEGLM